jgi:hypothetical protein
MIVVPWAGLLRRSRAARRDRGRQRGGGTDRQIHGRSPITTAHCLGATEASTNIFDRGRRCRNQSRNVRFLILAVLRVQIVRPKL